MPDIEFKIKLLLKTIQVSYPIRCPYFKGDEEVCGASGIGEYDWEEGYHLACNCDGNILDCDLPEKFQKDV
jgi:hypothetical protein